MKKLLIVLVAVIVLASCAGVGNKSRVCIEDAVSHNQERSENLERMHTEARVTDSCERIRGVGAGTVEFIEHSAYFRCDTADPIDDEDYATLLSMHMSSLRSNIESCLNW